MNLVELALTTFTESKAMEADAAGDRLLQEQADFVELARKCASSTLSPDAGELNWRYSVDGLPETVQEARAPIAPGRLEYLRYRADYTVEDDPSFTLELVQPCLACGVDQIDRVAGLFHLGQLLSRPEDEHPAPDDGDSRDPLAGIDALAGRAARMTRLARQLMADHPGAGLRVQFASVMGHQDGTARGELQLRAASVEAAAAVAEALGAELAVETTSSIPAYVFRRGDATVTVDGTEIQLSAHTQLDADEAAAWHAEQAQGTEDGDH